MTQPPLLDGLELSVIIPTRNRSEILAATLAALDAQTVTGFEVVVVVDGMDQTFDPREGVRFIQQEHRGPGAARNLGVSESRRPLLLFLGDDIIPRPRLVESHLRVHSDHPERQVAALGLTTWHSDAASSPHNQWLGWSGNQFDYDGIRTEDASWGRFYSSNVSLKRDLFLEAGGFDEDFDYDYEDLDLAHRLHLSGIRLLYSPTARADHLHRYTWNSLRRRYHSHGSAERLMAEKNPWFEPWFARRLRSAAEAQPRSALWVPMARKAARLPSRPRTAIRSRADTWYHQHLMAPFFGAWNGRDDVDDLKAYLADHFDPRALLDHRARVEAEEHSAPDHGTLYRTSEAYLYDLTMFSVWGTKEPYLATIRRLVPAPARVLDYGCGIGSDGLRLMDGGYDVAFADYDNPSTRFLRWRLSQRGAVADVFDIDQRVPGGFDLVYSFDVIEHVDDPFGFLGILESKGALVMVNFLEPDPSEAHVHYKLPIARLIAHAVRCGLVHYRRHEQRSHLVVYHSPAAGGRITRSIAPLVSGLIETQAERLVPMS